MLLIVGENFADAVTLFELDAATLLFTRRQSLSVPGAGSMAVFEAGDEVVLVAASYHDPHTGWRTRSLVFAADARAGSLDFSERQRIDTHGAHDADVAEAGGELFLFLSEDRSEASSRVDSSLHVWDREARRFRLFQAIPTDGAHAAEIFEGPDGAAYVMIANFGDRLGKRYAAKSTLWRQPHRGAQFELAAEVDSQGATDAEHFVVATARGRARHFVALANEGDIGARAHQRSVVYELLASDGAAEQDL